MNEKELLRLNRKMEVLIALFLRTLPEEARSLKIRDQIRILNGLGLGPTEIAGIIARTPKFVSKELSGIRKTTRRKSKNEIEAAP
jgi:hypothetical protein